MLILQHAPRQVVRLEGFEIEELEFDNGVSKFDLTLKVAEQDDGGLRCQFEYSTDLFEPASMERIDRHFVNLILEALNAPTTPIPRLPLLDVEERDRLLIAWNRTEADYNRDFRIDEAFAAVVRRDPEGTALIEAGRITTYAELDRRANQIAHALLTKQLAPGALVRESVPHRSVEVYCAILGILKAGCAYVPIDVAWPLSESELWLPIVGASKS